MNRSVAFARLLNSKLAPIVEFRRPEDDEMSPVVKGALTGVAAGTAGYGVKKALGTIGERRSGMRITVPGFTQKSRLGQIGAATASVADDALAKVGAHPIVSGIGNKVGGAIGAVASPVAKGVTAGAGVIKGLLYGMTKRGRLSKWRMNRQSQMGLAAGSASDRIVALTAKLGEPAKAA